MKVMLSLPPDTVAQLDELAARAGATRSGLVVQLAAGAEARDRQERHARVAELLGPPERRDGRATAHVKADRAR